MSRTCVLCPRTGGCCRQRSEIHPSSLLCFHPPSDYQRSTNGHAHLLPPVACNISRHAHGNPARSIHRQHITRGQRLRACRGLRGCASWRSWLLPERAPGKRGLTDPTTRHAGASNSLYKHARCTHSYSYIYISTMLWRSRPCKDR